MSSSDYEIILPSWGQRQPLLKIWNLIKKNIQLSSVHVTHSVTSTEKGRLDKLMLAEYLVHTRGVRIRKYHSIN